LVSFAGKKHARCKGQQLPSANLISQHESSRSVVGIIYFPLLVVDTLQGFLPAKEPSHKQGKPSDNYYYRATSNPYYIEVPGTW